RERVDPGQGQVSAADLGQAGRTRNHGLDREVSVIRYRWRHTRKRQCVAGEHIVSRIEGKVMNGNWCTKRHCPCRAAENGIVKSRVAPVEGGGAAQADAAGAAVEVTEGPGPGAAGTHGSAIRIPVTLLRMGRSARASRDRRRRERDTAKQTA